MSHPEDPGARRRDPVSRRLLRGGTEPDPRFTLANERTFLAGGIAVEAFTGDIFDLALRKVLSIVLLLLGMLLSAGAAVRWIKVERSMRHKTPLPLPLIAPFVAIGGAIASGVLVAVVLAR